MYASRDRRRAEPRILYWFRTPPNVRVGRAALDEEAIRAIEEHNPNLTFDWTKILRTKPPAPPALEESPRDRRRRERAEKGRHADRSAARPRPRAAAADAPPQPPAAEPVDALRHAPDEPAGPAADQGAGSGEEPAAETGQAALPPGLHVEERLGPEGFSRLRARHAELMARISERIQDPTRLEELRAEAERLNPDTWITDGEARAGIEGFDAAYETLRARLGRRRRSRRGGARRRRARSGGAAAGAVPAGSGTDEAEDGSGPWDEAAGPPEPGGNGEPE